MPLELFVALSETPGFLQKMPVNSSGLRKSRKLKGLL